MYYRSLAGKHWHTIRKCAEKEVPEGTIAEYIKQTEKPLLNGEIYLCPECGYLDINNARAPNTPYTSLDT